MTTNAPRKRPSKEDVERMKPGALPPPSPPPDNENLSTFQMINCLYANGLKCNCKEKIFGVFKQTCVLDPLEEGDCSLRVKIVRDDMFFLSPDPPQKRPNPIPPPMSFKHCSHSEKENNRNLKDISEILAILVSEMQTIKKEINQTKTPVNFSSKLRDQINNAPEPLRSYVHALDVGPSADLILENEKLRQEYEELKAYLKK